MSRPSRLPAPAPGRAADRGGSALLVVAVVGAVMAVLVVAGISTAQSAIRTWRVAQDRALAFDLADAAIARYEARLRVDPWTFTSEVFDDCDVAERARVCVDATVLQPGDDASDCLPAWTYTDAATSSATVLLEVTPPTLASPTLQVDATAVGPAGVAQVTRSVVFAPDSVATWTVLADGDVDLAALRDPAVETTAAGATVYAGGQVVVDPATAFTGSVFVSEVDPSPLPADPANRWYLPSGDSPRQVAPAPLRVEQLRPSASRAADVACPAAAPSPQQLTLPSGQQVSGPSSLCLQAGRQVVLVDGTVHVLPAGAVAWLLQPSVLEPGVTVLRVHAALTSPADCTDPLLPCGFVDVGTVRLPISGVVGSADDVLLGCTATLVTQVGLGDPCVQPAGYDTSFTVVAGTVTDPADVYVTGPLVRDGQATLATVPFGDLLVTGAARDVAGDLELDLAAVPLGLGDKAGRRGTADPTLLWPSALRPWPVDDPAYDGTGRLTWHGAVAAADLSLANHLFGAVHVRPLPQLATAPPPWLPTLSTAWVRSASR